MTRPNAKKKGARTATSNRAASRAQKAPAARRKSPAARLLEKLNTAIAYVEQLTKEGVALDAALSLAAKKHELRVQDLRAQYKSSKRRTSAPPSPERFVNVDFAFDPSAANKDAGFVGDVSKHTASVQFTNADHVEIARETRNAIAKLGYEHQRFDEGAYHVYDSHRGIWLALAREYLGQIVHTFSGAQVLQVNLSTREIVRDPDTQEPVVAYLLGVNASTVSGTISRLNDSACEGPFFCEAPAGVVFADGFVSVSAEGLELLPHAPEHRARRGYAFPFPEEDQQPNLWLELLEEAFAGDADAEQKSAAIEELLGASLIGKATTFHTALVTHGEGSNGKGLLADAAEGVFPPDSVSAVAPQDDKYDYPRLAGKLLNIDRDVSVTSLADTGKLKKAIAGEKIVVRDVRNRSFEMIPRAGWIYSINQFFAVKDRTRGFRRRHMVIGFNNELVFTEKEIAKRIVATEGPLIAARWLRAAARLMARGHYDVPPSSEVLMTRWMGEADVIETFFDECVTAEDSARVKPNDFYMAFVRWMKEQTEFRGKTVPSITAFGTKAKKTYSFVTIKGLDYYRVVVSA